MSAILRVVMIGPRCIHRNVPNLCLYSYLPAEPLAISTISRFEKESRIPPQTNQQQQQLQKKVCLVKWPKFSQPKSQLSEFLGKFLPTDLKLWGKGKGSGKSSSMASKCQCQYLGLAAAKDYNPLPPACFPQSFCGVETLGLGASCVCCSSTMIICRFQVNSRNYPSYLCGSYGKLLNAWWLVLVWKPWMFGTSDGTKSWRTSFAISEGNSKPQLTNQW